MNSLWYFHKQWERERQIRGTWFKSGRTWISAEFSRQTPLSPCLIVSQIKLNLPSVLTETAGSRSSKTLGVTEEQRPAVFHISLKKKPVHPSGLLKSELNGKSPSPNISPLFGCFTTGAEMWVRRAKNKRLRQSYECSGFTTELNTLGSPLSFLFFSCRIKKTKKNLIRPFSRKEQHTKDNASPQRASARQVGVRTHSRYSDPGPRPDRLRPPAVWNQFTSLKRTINNDNHQQAAQNITSNTQSVEIWRRNDHKRVKTKQQPKTKEMWHYHWTGRKCAHENVTGEPATGEGETDVRSREQSHEQVTTPTFIWKWSSIILILILIIIIGILSPMMLSVCLVM